MERLSSNATLFLNIFLFSFGQITYTKIPLDLQLVARDKITNLGNVIIEGNVDLMSNYSFIRAEVYRNDKLLNTDETLYISYNNP